MSHHQWSRTSCGFCAITLVKSQDSACALMLFLRIASRWAVSESSTTGVSRWQAGANEVLLVPLISSLFSSVINYSCPAQHLEQTRALQAANLRSSPGQNFSYLPSNAGRRFGCIQGLPVKNWDTWSIFSSTWGNLGNLRLEAVALNIHIEHELISDKKFQ